MKIIIIIINIYNLIFSNFIFPVIINHNDSMAGMEKLDASTHTHTHTYKILRRGILCIVVTKWVILSQNNEPKFFVYGIMDYFGARRHKMLKNVSKSGSRFFCIFSFSRNSLDPEKNCGNNPYLQNIVKPDFSKTYNCSYG
jgi:hypothetical protein